MDETMYVICTACTLNKPYSDNIKVLLQSLKNTNKNIIQVFVGVFTNDTLAFMRFDSECKEVYKNVMLNQEVGDKNDANVYRADVMSAFLQDGSHDSVAWFDSDIIIRGSILELLSESKEPTLKIMYRINAERNRSRFQNGIIVFSNHLECKILLACWRERLKKDNSWYQDQLTLYQLWASGYGISLLPISQRYNDWEFSDNSIIWHAKSSHMDQEPFKSEYWRLLDEANENIH